MMSVTASALIASWLGIAVCPPPEAKRGRRHGVAPHCWLCGGDTHGEGWPRDTLLPPTFTQHNIARRIDSDSVCQPCAAILRGEVFQDMVRARALPVKTWTQCGWHSYSHHVREDGHYAVPDRETSRAILIDPPPRRWALALNPTGQQHTLIRAHVASSRDCFPVQLGETAVWIDEVRFRACLAAFEALSALGFGKDDILSGAYHPESMRRAGLARWRPAEEAVRPWREDEPGMFALVHHVARSPKHFAPVEPPAPATARQGQPAQRPVPSQMELF